LAAATVDDSAEPQPPAPVAPQDKILAALAELHQRFEDEQISFEDFESSKAGLLAQLHIS
jgi:hypothetical protein